MIDYFYMLAWIIALAMTFLLKFLYYQIIVKGYVRRIKKAVSNGETEKAEKMKRTAIRKHPQRMNRLFAKAKLGTTSEFTYSGIYEYNKPILKKRKSKKLRIILIIFSVFLISGFLSMFLQNGGTKTIISMKQDISSMEQAYQMADDYVQAQSPGAILTGYGLEIKGNEAILNAQPFQYNFRFANSSTGVLLDAPITRFYITLDLNNQQMSVQRDQISEPLGVYNQDFPLYEPDVGKMLDMIKSSSDIDRIGSLLAADSDIQISFTSGYLANGQQSHNNSWVVFTGPTHIDGESFSYVVNMDHGTAELWQS